MGKQFGKWEVTQSLDEGGQAWVYLVKDTASDSDKQYILKRLKNANRLGRFKTEIESLQKLDHPGIVKLLDFDISDKNPWFVQEYYSGGNLEQYVNSQGALGYDEALSHIENIATVLEYAHFHGYIHRDVKPTNIFLSSEDNKTVLGDFGLVWQDDSGSRVTTTNEAVGSFHYIAPELADGQAEPTSKCDIYSLESV